MLDDAAMMLLFAVPASLAATLSWGVIGLVVGSFLNVVIHRMPVMMQRESENDLALENDEPPPHTTRYNLFVPRSACTTCGHQLTAMENIPLISYFWLHGRCRQCSAPISSRYPVVEVTTGALSALVAWQLGTGAMGLGALVFLWMLIAMSFIDADTQMLPDDLTLPLLWIGLLVNIHGLFVPLADAVIGAVAGYLTLWAVYWVFRLLTGKEGMGYGDFKLLAALGAWLGWTMLPLVILLSSAVGAVVGLVMIAFGRHHRDIPIPFGPYLAAAGLVALLFGQSLINAYLGKT